MHHTADFEQIGMHDIEHHVIAENAESHALAQFGAQPPRFRERDQPAAVFAQFAHIAGGPGGIVPRDIGGDLIKVGFGTAAEAKAH